MEFEHHATHVINDNEHYRAVIDEHRRGQEQMCILHLRFKQFSKASFQKLLDDWKVMRSTTRAPLFAYAQQDDHKWERFVRHLGFQPVSEFQAEDGRPRRMFVSLPGEGNA